MHELDPPTDRATDPGRPAALSVHASHGPTRATTFARSLRYAGAGLGYLVRTQRNARIHLAIAGLVVALGACVGVSRVEWAVLVLCIAGVLVLEAINTAIEAAVDLAMPRRHPLAKVAKDVAAGAVLIAAVAAVVVGVMILGPALLGRIRG